MKTIKPTQQFRNCFFKVLLATQETDFDDDAITDAIDLTSGTGKGSVTVTDETTHMTIEIILLFIFAL